jgi:hypothetical protein
LTEGWGLKTFQLRRRDMKDVTWLTIADAVPAATMFYEDKGLKRGVTWQWQVYAWLQPPDGGPLVLSDPWPHDAAKPPCLTIKPMPPMGTVGAEPLLP